MKPPLDLNNPGQRKTVSGAELLALIKDLALSLPDPLPDLIRKTSEISCYLRDTPAGAPLMMMLSLTLSDDEGVLEKLTGDAALGSLFIVTGAVVLLLRCPGGSCRFLKDHCKVLAA